MDIGLDVESVLANTNEAVLRSTDELDRSELLGSWNLSDEQWQIYMGVSDAVWRHDPGCIPPEEPNLDRYVRALRNRNEVHIVTGRCHVDEQIMWWLDEHGIEYDSFCSTDEPKYEVTDHDIYIDDNPDMVGMCRLLLRDQRWNQDVDLDQHKRTDRIVSVHDALQFVPH